MHLNTKPQTECHTHTVSSDTHSDSLTPAYKHSLFRTDVSLRGQIKGCFFSYSLFKITHKPWGPVSVALQWSGCKPRSVLGVPAFCFGDHAEWLGGTWLCYQSHNRDLGSDLFWLAVYEQLVSLNALNRYEILKYQLCTADVRMLRCSSPLNSSSQSSECASKIRFEKLKKSNFMFVTM